MRPKALWILRAAAATILIIIAFKPVTVRPDKSVPSAWAVLVDSSRSMAVKDPEQRFASAKKVVRIATDMLKDPQVSTFSDGVAPASLEQLEKVDPSGPKSNLAQAIEASVGNQSVRAAVVVTDGRQVGQGDAVSAAASAGRPLLLVGVGDKGTFRDVAVRAIQSPPFAFKNVETSLSATVSAVGFNGKKLTIKLREGERVLSVQTITVPSSEFETTVSFSWTPTSVGSKLVTVSVSQLPDEVTHRNNSKDVTLDVGRDRFRVLYICGVPGPEYGFLRYQFKSDPAVELVTFVILRNASNVANVPEHELSLIPFPTQDVLINQLSTFDLVVFEEFAYWEFGLMPTVLQAIRKRVEEGGSFLLMGGPVAFGLGSGYAVPGIQEMLPVQFGRQDIQVAPGPIKLNARIPDHPAMRLDENRQRNAELWSRLVPIEDVALLPGVKPTASVLASVSVEGREYPVLTVWRHGKGRVAAMTTRSTWRWSMIPSGKEHLSFTYQQFWKSMVLWLTHSDEYKTVRIGVEGKNVKLGENSMVRVWVYDEYFKPIADADVRIQLTGPNEEQETLQPHAETIGVYSAPLIGKQLGAHRLQAFVSRKGKRYGEDTLRFQVLESQLEEEDLRPDFPHLRELAEVTGGRFVPVSEFNKDVLDDFSDQVSAKLGRKVLIWNSPWLFAVLMILMLGEWALRKRRGLP